MAASNETSERPTLSSEISAKPHIFLISPSFLHVAIACMYVRDSNLADKDQESCCSGWMTVHPRGPMRKSFCYWWHCGLEYVRAVWPAASHSAQVPCMAVEEGGATYSHREVSIHVKTRMEVRTCVSFVHRQFGGVGGPRLSLG